VPPVRQHRVAFNGSGHFVDINSNQLSNSDGPEVWYTDARSGSDCRRWTTRSAWAPAGRWSAETALLGRGGARPEL